MRRLKKALFAFGMLAALFTPAAAHCEESFERALALASEQRYSEARDVLGPLLEREPGHSRARLLDGILHARAGHLSDAVEVFEALGASAPTCPSRTTTSPSSTPCRVGSMMRARPCSQCWNASRTRSCTRTSVTSTRSSRTAPTSGPASSSPAAGHARNRRWTLPSRFRRGRTTPRAASRGHLPRSHAVMGKLRAARARRCPGPRRRLPPSVRTPEGSGTAELSPTQRCGFSPTVRRFWRCATRNAGSQAATGSFCRPWRAAEAATAKLREIRARGVRDVAVIDDGALANGISFGVFRKADNMHRRVAALGRVGYPVRSVPEDVKIVEDFVIRARADGAPAALDAAWASRFPGHSIRIVDCG